MRPHVADVGPPPEEAGHLVLGAAQVAQEAEVVLREVARPLLGGEVGAAARAAAGHHPDFEK